MCTRRYEPLIVVYLGASAFGQPQHHAHARAVDISIQDTNLGALARQSQREVGGGSGLAHTAFTRGYGNYIFDLSQRRHLALQLASNHFTTYLYMRFADFVQILDRSLNHVRYTADDGASRIAQHQFGANHTTFNIQLPQTTAADQVNFQVRVLVLGDSLLYGSTINLAHIGIRFTKEWALCY